LQGRRTLILFGISTILLIAVHATFLPRKIRRIEPDEYTRYAIDLRVAPKERIGFVSGTHGAVLVRATNSGGAPHNERGDPKSQELRAFMARELERIPTKFLGETLFYVTLLAYAVLLLPRLRRVARRIRTTSLRWLAAILPGGILFVLAAAPLLIWGYGYGGFSNLVGPNAMSFSGPYFHLNTWLNNSSNSVSYRAFISPILLPPSILVELAWWGFQRLPVYGVLLDTESESVWSYWIAGTIFYGLAFLGVHELATLLSRRRRLTPV
jgi:hypothetical protein